MLISINIGGFAQRLTRSAEKHHNIRPKYDNSFLYRRIAAAVVTGEHGDQQF
jgi:hypothetical protein